jgi:hypothetical protein
MTSDRRYPDEEGEIVLLRNEIEQLRAERDGFRAALVKHHSGLVGPCFTCEEG